MTAELPRLLSCVADATDKEGQKVACVEIAATQFFQT